MISPSYLLSLSRPSALPSNLALLCRAEERSTICFYKAGRLKSSRFRPRCCSSGRNSLSFDENSSSFCIIEGPETVEDFVQMQLQEIDDNIRSRRNKIFLLMEETPKTMKQLHLTSFLMVSGIIMFGGLLAPILELKLGLGGTSYEDFIQNMHLPSQLSQVDPIISSFSGGAVGVISALMLIEANNVEQQQKKRCKYCHGAGYLACARCSASGVFASTEPVSVAHICGHSLQPPTIQRCPNCSGTGKVMCPTCLCTGMAMASEHDPRIDPFD
ncbi:hypothetical protein M5K25_002666 [Dendrobium thyrsiflorum]|uniref:Uncharacterized protein n=1 Tax=Dendrobium thyrsiflorum TaxID=117978 RepID=A0ABD0VNT9_DENTH